MEKRKYVLFDFDGVIADSFQIALSVERVAVPNLAEDAYRRLYEGNINELENHDDQYAKQVKHDEAFWERYSARVKHEARLFPQMCEVIADFARRYTLIIVSSSTSDLIYEILKRESLEGHFTEILGNDVHPNKAVKIEMIFDKHGVASQDCVFITDTLGDIREGEQVGVGSIAVTWGFNDADVLSRGAAFRLVDKPDALASAVTDFFAR